MNLKKIVSVLFFQIVFIPAIAQQSEVIRNINTKLSKGETTVSNVLSDTSFMSLHPLIPFREVIKQNAKAEKIKLTSDSEPGIKISVTGLVRNTSGNPLANELVYLYQTSAEGWYADPAPHILVREGDRRHARLFGYLKTDSKGKFEFLTVKPKGYPNSTLPAHIHIEISLDNGQTFISELLFDDDPRLVGEIRARSLNDKFLISKNNGTGAHPVYSYEIQIAD